MSNNQERIILPATDEDIKILPATSKDLKKEFDVDRNLSFNEDFHGVGDYGFVGKDGFVDDKKVKKEGNGDDDDDDLKNK